MFFRFRRKRKKSSVRRQPIPIKNPRLLTLRKAKTRELNTLGRLEAFRLSRSVPDNRFGVPFRKAVLYHNKNLDSAKNFRHNSKYIRLRFDNDSFICESRRARRDEIMRKTGGKGLKVKNALWNVISFIQCRK